MDIVQIIERWGFPVAFAVWLMWLHTREVREMRSQLTKLVVINVVILKTLDVPEAVALASGSTTEGGK